MPEVKSKCPHCQKMVRVTVVNNPNVTPWFVRHLIDVKSRRGGRKMVQVRRPCPGSHSAAHVEGRCRVCGCTDTDCRRCIAKTGEPCFWVEPDLCSACDVLRVRQAEAACRRRLDLERRGVVVPRLPGRAGAGGAMTVSKPTNCPNCGAALKRVACDYCGSVVGGSQAARAINDPKKSAQPRTMKK